MSGVSTPLSCLPRKIMGQDKLQPPVDESNPSSPPPAPAPLRPTWKDYLAINSSTGALLGAIILICMGSELWGPFLPKYMSDLQAGIMVIALYGSFRDVLEAVNYLMGGWISGRLNTRRSLLLFNATPLVGLVILLIWQNAIAVFIAIPFVFVWDSLAGPALLTVVGDSLPSSRRAMAFSLQSLSRRMARILAYGLNALLVLLVGTKLGMQAAFGVSIGVVLLSLLVQGKFMKTASKDASTIIHHPMRVLRQFDPQLKRLLVADIFARWAEGTPRELIMLFSLPVLMASGLDKPSAWAMYGTLLIVSQVTSAITYLPMGAIASRPGLGKKPYIGLTFFFFASFPTVLALMGYVAREHIVPAGWVFAAMAVAFVFMGMREIGEPARKAMIVDLIPPQQKTQSIGIYWAFRSVMVMAAPIVGGAVWVGTNWICNFTAPADDPIGATGPGPLAMLIASSIFGTIGVFYYYRRFGKPVTA